MSGGSLEQSQKRIARSLNERLVQPARDLHYSFGASKSNVPANHRDRYTSSMECLQGLISTTGILCSSLKDSNTTYNVADAKSLHDLVDPAHQLISRLEKLIKDDARVLELTRGATQWLDRDETICEVKDLSESIQKSAEEFEIWMNTNRLN